MTDDLYTAKQLASELTNEAESQTYSEEYVSQQLEDLEEAGVVTCVDGEHWKIKNLRGALMFLLKNSSKSPVSKLRNLKE